MQILSITFLYTCVEPRVLNQQLQFTKLSSSLIHFYYGTSEEAIENSMGTSDNFHL
jgi:hypothetical protein